MVKIFTKLSEAPKAAVGDRYGRLIITEKAEPKMSGEVPRRAWACACDCGKKVIVLDQALRSGMTKSCGCIAAEKAKECRHGACKNRKQSKAYRAWRDMLQRCYNPKVKSYPNYGGRGIAVVDEWRSFDSFLADMGECPDGRTLDRLDPNLGYSPSNCHWGSWADQALNKRSNNTQLITHNGLTLAPSEWAKRLGIPYSTILGRRKKGWPVALILSPATLIGRNRNGKLTTR